MSAQHGAALAVSLILLLLLSLFALSGARLAAAEQRIALGEEQGLVAVEQAQSLIELALRGLEFTPAMRWTVLCAGADCANPSPELSQLLQTADAGVFESGAIDLAIRGLPAPELPPPPGSGYSADKIAAVQLRIEAGVAHDDAGAAQIFEGVELLKGASTLRSGHETRDEFGGS